MKIHEKQEIVEIKSSHRTYPRELNLLTELYNGIKKDENIWDKKGTFDFFDSWQFDDSNGKFRYYITM